MALKPYGIAATLIDAIALTAAFGTGAKIGIGAGTAGKSDILAPVALTLQPQEAAAALRLGRPHYIFTFGNADAGPPPAVIGPTLDQLAAASGVGFLAACLAAPWLGRTVYQGCLFQDGRLRYDLKRELGPCIDGAIAILPREVVAEGGPATRLQLTAMKERGIRLALLDAIDEDDCGIVGDALARQPVIAGPAWLCPRSPDDGTGAAIPSGPLAILSGAGNRQTLIQLAQARLSMPVLDLDLAEPDPAAQLGRALAWARPYFRETPFVIATSAPPDRMRLGAPAAAILASIAGGLEQAGIRNFLIAGNDTAAAVLSHLGITTLAAGAPFAGMRWLAAGDTNFLMKPGSFGSKNLFLYDFEPQSRLNEPAK